MKYKTRFAPSPTGMLHIGGVRTALFDYLTARNSGGEFCLRIEDTDRERFVEGAVEAIHEGLSWLGLDYDGEVISQSERVPVYQGYAKQLLESGAAYKCFCTPERLTDLKAAQEADKLPPVYDRRCLSLTKEEVVAKEKAGEKHVVRFMIPPNPTEVSWTDKVRNRIAIPTKPLEDFILIKSDGWPTYNFANVIDDHEMHINLVIRGDEFVPSTPKHILLYKALGWKHPDFAHVPVIVGSDMKKLSKRNGDTSLSEYREKGYLPEALINFLSFLGWNPGSTEEVFSLSQLERAFSINRVGKSPAVFDIERLNYMNGVYIRNLDVKELAKRLIDFNPDHSKVKQTLFERVVAIEQTRIKTLAEFSDIAAPYWTLPQYSKELLVFKKSTPESTKIGLEQSLLVISTISDNDFDKMGVDDFNLLLTKVTTDNKLGNADVFWPVRVALSGCDKSASPAEILWALGKEESISRIKHSL